MEGNFTLTTVHASQAMSQKIRSLQKKSELPHFHGEVLQRSKEEQLTTLVGAQWCLNTKETSEQEPTALICF